MTLPFKDLDINNNLYNHCLNIRVLSGEVRGTISCAALHARATADCLTHRVAS